MFFSSLHFAISSSSYSNIKLKVKQLQCLDTIYPGGDVVAVLPIGYGKSLIFHILPALLCYKMNGQSPLSQVRAIVFVVSPLNALIKNLIKRSKKNIKLSEHFNFKNWRRVERTPNSNPLLSISCWPSLSPCDCPLRPPPPLPSALSTRNNSFEISCYRVFTGQNMTSIDEKCQKSSCHEMSLFG